MSLCPRMQREGRKRTKKIFLIAKFPKFDERCKFTDLRYSQTHLEKERKATPRYITVKLLKAKDE